MSTNEVEGRSTSRITLFLILFAGTLFVLIPFLFLGMPARRDFSHHLHLARMFYSSILSGNFIPSWPGDVNGGYGDVSLRFHPPALAFIWATARILLRSWYWSAVAVFTSLTFLGALGTYWWAKQFIHAKFAVWAGFIYVIAPYHLNELFQSSLLGEYAAACVLPFTFAFTEKICRGGNKRDVAGLGAAYALVVLFDLPLAVITSYALLFYFLIRLDWSQKTASFARFAAGICLGLFCSCFYLVTVLAELPWMRKDTLNVFSGKEFVFSTFYYDPKDTGIFYANFLAFATWALLLPAVILLSRKYRTIQKQLLWGVGALTVMSFVMMTKISYPLWEILPKLKEVQTSWRWLAISSIGTPVLLAASIPAWWTIARGRLRPLALLAIGSVLLSVAFTISHPIREAGYLSRSEVDLLANVLEGYPTIGPWWPVWVNGEIPEMLDEISVGGRKVDVTQSTPEHRAYVISAGSAVETRVRSLYYPLWVATAGGKQLAAHPAPDGVLMISLPTEAATVNLDFREPPRSLISGVVSALAWMLFVALVLLPGRKRVNAATSPSEVVEIA
jgi:hypothetical protein